MMSPMDLFEGAARGAVILAAALAAMPLLRRAPASTRRLVIALALAAAAIVPVVSRAVPSIRVLPSAPITVVGSPFAEPPEPGVAALSIPAGGVVAAPRETLSPSRARGSFSWGSVPWGSVLVAVWALGALAVLARLAAGLWQARALVRRAKPIAEIDDAPALFACAIEPAFREAGLCAEVRVSDEVSAPLVTGVVRPVVIVPPAALEWSAARWRAVLLHELSHVAQRDCLAQIAAQIACAVHWFDPLAWVLARRLTAERELSADERVLALGARATEYAEHLLAIAASASQGRAVPGGALGMADRSQLLARVEAIVRPGAGAVRASKSRAIAIAATVLALLGVVACASPDQHGQASSPASTSRPESGKTGLEGAPATGTLAERVAAVVGAPGGRVELTIRPEMQAIVDEEMKRLESERHPESATAVVLDPASGEVLAIANPDFAARARTTGSTMKSLTIAAALEEGAITPADRFFCDRGRRSYGGDLVLRDAGSYEELSVPEILTVSSNIGASRIYDKLGGERLGKWLRKLHFGDASAVPLREGAIDPVPVVEDGSFRGAAIAGGHGGALASPLHLVAAYAALANHGVYNKPVLARRVLGADGRPTYEHAPENERLFRPETASAVIGMLERVVYDEKGTGKAARVEGVRVAGKTGTSDLEGNPGQTRYYASFVGVVPSDSPRFVILVGAVASGEEATGGRVAAPVFARIAARALAR